MARQASSFASFRRSQHFLGQRFLGRRAPGWDTSAVASIGRRAAGVETVALADLRRLRRLRAYGSIDWMDAIYRVYVAAILSAMGTSLISGWVGGRKVTPAELATVVDRGPALIGLVLAAIVAGGLRSGGRGGPLVLEAADVAHVLMAPVPRAIVLRGPAWHRLRFTAFVGAVTGMVAGNLAAQRLPGTYAAWVAWGGAAGAVTGLAFTGAAIATSGLRAGRRMSGLAAALLLGWSVADSLAGTSTSPITLLGRMAMAALDGIRWPGLGGVVLVLPVLGLAVVGGTSLEAARRQAGLAAQLRFAVTMQDVRTVVLLRRQLAAEGPRRRPWMRLRAIVDQSGTAGSGSGGSLSGGSEPAGTRAPGARVVWRRDWQGVLRWPAVRVLRLVALGAAGGAAAAAAWRGTPALIVVTGIALLVAGLDSVEGLAQEADHPLWSDTLPVRRSWLVERHLAVGSVVMVGVVLVAGAAGAFASGAPLGAAGVGAVVAIPAALAALVGAALSISVGPVDTLAVEIFGNAKMFIRAVGPVALAVVGVLPVLAARAAVDAGETALAGAVPAAMGVLLVSISAAALLRRNG